MAKTEGDSAMTFQDVVKKMPVYMGELKNCEAISMNTRVERRALSSKLPAREGVYVLYERGRPMYVGRSDNLTGIPHIGSLHAQWAVQTR